MTSKTIRALLVFMTVLSGISPVQAQTFQEYAPEEGLYTAHFPPDFRKHDQIIQLSPKYKIISGETKAAVEEKKGSDKKYTFLIKYDQTLGQDLTEADKQTLVHEELEKYASYYKTLGGSVNTINSGVADDGTTLGAMDIAYTDPKIGPQNIRAQILFSNKTKFQQILVSPKDSVPTFSTNAFFNALQISDGYFKSPSDIKAEWTPLHTPMDLFTVYFPPPTQPYFPEAPKVKSTEKTEQILAAFYDPLWKQNIFVKVHGFEMDRGMSYDTVIEFLKEHYIKKHRIVTDDVPIIRDTKDNFNIARCSYAIIPPDGYAYLDTVSLYAMFIQNYVMVIEVTSSPRMKDAEIIQSIIDTVEFTPNKAKMLRLQKDKKRAITTGVSP